MKNKITIALHLCLFILAGISQYALAQQRVATRAVIAGTGVGAGNMQIIDAVSRAGASAKPDPGEQQIFCQEFLNENFNGLQSKVNQYGYELHDIYNDVTCDRQTKADLIRHRASISTAASDIMSLARFYIRDNNDPEGLTAIFNKVIDNPGKPRGTLLDFTDYYSTNPDLSEMEKANFSRYESTIRRFGGKRESEL